jgi:adenylate cyclase
MTMRHNRFAGQTAGEPLHAAAVRLRDLEEPISAAVTMLGDMLNGLDKKEHPPDLISDIRKMRSIGRGLLRKLRQPVNGDDPGLRRHDLRNALNPLMGLCQLALLREEEDGFGAFSKNFQMVYQFCQEFNHNLSFNCTVPFRSSEQPRPHKLRVPTSAKPGNLLVVDDNTSAREVLCHLLAKRGHKVAQASDGREALALMKANAFDLVLLDLLLPGIDGFQVLKRLKARPGLARSSVIVISGVEQTQQAIKCIALGAEDYLTKPIDNLLLQARVDSCLYKRQLRLRELEQFFPARVAQELHYQPRLIDKGREAEVTVLFCDVRGFSKISEKLDAAALMKWVRAVMEVLSECVVRRQGVLVDFQGDGLLAMWGAPEDQPNHAELACDAAREMLAEIKTLDAAWRPIIGFATEVTVGINSGKAHVGNSGSGRRFKYGPLGSTVNLGSRVQGATKYLKTSLLISGGTRRLLGPHIKVRRLGKIKVINMDKPVELYEIVRPEQPCALYEKALDLFENNRTKEAAEILGQLVTEQGARGPELWLLARAVECLIEPTKWSSVWELPGK